MRIKPFQAVYPNFDYITSADSFFGTVKYEYPEYVESGFFQKTSQEAIYIYQIKAIGRIYTGIVACADIRDYKDGKIKKHENTLAEKEQQQMHLMLKRNAMVKIMRNSFQQNLSKMSKFTLCGKLAMESKSRNCEIFLRKKFRIPILQMDTIEFRQQH